MHRHLAIALLLVFLGTAVHADPLYLSNRRYNGMVRTDGAGAPWVRLMEFVKAAGIYPGSITATPPYHGSVKVTYQGHTFRLAADESTPDGAFVPARPLVEALGGTWNANGATHIIDVYVPVQSRLAHLPSAPDPMVLQSKDYGSPFKFDTFNYNDPTLPGNFSNYMVNGTLVVRNTGDSFVDGVDLAVHIMDGNDAVLTTLTKHVGHVVAGQEIHWDWQWNNVSLLQFHPLAEVVCDPYLTADERKAMKKPHGGRLTVRALPTEGNPAAAPGTGGQTDNQPQNANNGKLQPTAPGVDTQSDPVIGPRPSGY